MFADRLEDAIANEGFATGTTYEVCAENAYTLADAMLAERAKGEAS